MLARVTRPGENLRDYFYEKLTLLSRCEIAGRKAVDCVVHGIIDLSIRNGAQALQCKEPEDLLFYLASQKIKENALQSIQPIRRKDPRNTSMGYVNRNNNATGSNYMLCFNCNERDHAFTKCPKPLIKCHKCGRIGHDLESCHTILMKERR